MADPNAELSVNLKANPGHQGPQIILNWDLPAENWDELVLVRKLGDYPQFVSAPISTVTTFTTLVSGDDSLSGIVAPFNFPTLILTGNGDAVTQFHAYYRFLLNIPRGSTITSAAMDQFVETIIGAVIPADTFNIQLIDDDDQPDYSTYVTFPDTFLNASLAVAAAAPVLNSVPLVADVGTVWSTGDIASILQAYIDRPGYSPGQHIGIKFDHGTMVAGASIAFRTKDHPTGPPPVLNVSYDAPYTGDGKVLMVVTDEEHGIALTADDLTSDPGGTDTSKVQFGEDTGTIKRGWLRFETQTDTAAAIGNARLKTSVKVKPLSTMNAFYNLKDEDDADFTSNPHSSAIVAGLPSYFNKILPADPIGTKIVSANMKELVQAYIDRPGYMPGNHIGLRIDAGPANPTNIFSRVDDFGDVSGGAKLQVQAAVPVGTNEILTSLNINLLSDRGMEGQQVYYYRMFVKRRDTGLYVLPNDNEAKALACETGFHPAKMFLDLLPIIYNQEDANTLQDPLETIVVDQTELTETLPNRLPSEIPVTVFDGEVFNFKEDVSKGKGQLERFLKITGNRFDQIKCLIDSFPSFFDVDSASCEFLPLIAALLGFDLNQELTIAQQRQEIKNQVAILRLKGTIPGIISLIKSLTSAEAVVVIECYTLIFYANDEDSLTLNPTVGADPGGENDIMHTVLNFGGGTQSGPSCLRIFITISEELGLSEILVNKLNRILPDFLPAGVEATISVDTDITFSGDVGDLLATDGASTDDEILVVFLANNEFSLTNDENSLIPVLT